jgi:hypothetical protein
LSNNNEKATVPILQKNLHLNQPQVVVVLLSLFGLDSPVQTPTRLRSFFRVVFAHPRGAYDVSNVTSIEKRGRDCGCSADARRRRRHQGEAVEGEEGDATPDLFLKHSDVTLAT